MKITINITKEELARCEWVKRNLTGIGTAQIGVIMSKRIANAAKKQRGR